MKHFRKVKGFDLEEKLVYQIIEEAGNKGRFDSILAPSHFFRVLRVPSPVFHPGFNGALQCKFRNMSAFLGIWIRDIRYKSNLQLTQVNKILKTLESKKLIKAIKSVAVIHLNSVRNNV